MDTTVLELEVRNHPGVLSHVSGLFARRLYNLESIVCYPKPGGEVSCMWLKVREGERLGQVISQLEKLEDVLLVSERQQEGKFNELIAGCCEM